MQCIIIVFISVINVMNSIYTLHILGAFFPSPPNRYWYLAIVSLSTVKQKMEMCMWFWRLFDAVGVGEFTLTERNYQLRTAVIQTCWSINLNGSIRKVHLVRRTQYGTVTVLSPYFEAAYTCNILPLKQKLQSLRDYKKWQSLHDCTIHVLVLCIHLLYVHCMVQITN